MNAAQKILALLKSEYCAEDLIALTDSELRAMRDRVTNVYWHTTALMKARKPQKEPTE